MSRGLGKLQRELLAYLEFVGEIANNDLRNDTRRAMRGLGKRGLVKAYRTPFGEVIFQLAQPDND